MQYVSLSTLNNFLKRRDNKNANVLIFLLVLYKNILNVYPIIFIYICTHLLQQH